jgi:hypothetical protein
LCEKDGNYVFVSLKSGPYTFGLGLATYLCSKEIYIMEHEFYTGLSIAIMGIYAVKKLGPATAKFLDAEVAVSEIKVLRLAPQLIFHLFLLEIRR